MNQLDHMIVTGERCSIRNRFPKESIFHLQSIIRASLVWVIVLIDDEATGLRYIYIKPRLTYSTGLRFTMETLIVLNM